MDLIGQIVIHNSFGEGKIIKQQDNYLIIQFTQGEKRFLYPTSFINFLKAKDEEINIQIQKEIEVLKQKNRMKEEYQKVNEIQKQTLTNVRKKKVYPRANIAFKCNFCDGGQSEHQVGFNGVCSDAVIYNNIEIEKRTWCCSEECACTQYLNGEISRNKLDFLCTNDGFVCYESQMLRDWKALAGIVQSGENKGQPMKLNQVQANSLCVLTTRDPSSTENERYIFAVFLVDETYEGDNREEGYVTTSTKYKIMLSPKEAHSMLFWDYHANDNQPEIAVWSSGLHRYFNDEEATQILKDISKIKQGTPDKELADEFLNHFIKINNVDIENLPERNGTLHRNGK